MKCQSLFSGKNRKNIAKLLSAELAQRVVEIKDYDISLPGNKRRPLKQLLAKLTSTTVGVNNNI